MLMRQVKPVSTKIQMLLPNEHKNQLPDGGQINIKTLYFKLYRVRTERMRKKHMQKVSKQSKDKL